jgi:hypothetical protein
MSAANNSTAVAAALMDLGQALAPSLGQAQIAALLAEWLGDAGAATEDPAERTRRFLRRVRDELLVRGLHDEAEGVKALLRVSLRGVAE